MRRTYSGDVVGRLSEQLKDVHGRREIGVLEVMQRFRVGPGELLLPHVLHHLGLKLCVHRTRLDQGQPVERQTTRSQTGGLFQPTNAGSAHLTSNLKSCTAKLSQKPSMANLEAAYTSLNATPTEKCTFQF